MANCGGCFYYSKFTYEEKQQWKNFWHDGYCSRLSKKVNNSSSCDLFESKAKYKKAEKEELKKINFKNSACFLTSACVEYLGKADDCEELTALRLFRDSYMQTTDGGKELIKEYYEIAPKIVERINCSDNKDKYYQYISEVIDKCVKLIKLNKNESALTEYKFMVENLSKEFALT